MKPELSNAGRIPASAAAINLTTVCADVEIRIGEGEFIDISAQTPSFWKVGADGSITEVGGPVAEALKAHGSGNAGGNTIRSINFIGSTVVSSSTSMSGSGWVNGDFVVNGKKVEVPDPREQLVIYVPLGFAGDILIDAQYFGTLSIAAELKGRLKALVSSRVQLTTGDQKSLKGASLKASMGARIVAGEIDAHGGGVDISAEMSGSSVTVGVLRSAEGSLKASSGGVVESGNLHVKGELTIKAEMSGSRIHTGTVRAADVTAKAESGGKVVGKNVKSKGPVQLKSSMSGSRITLEHVSATEVFTKAESGGKITGKNLGVKEGVVVKADMSGSEVNFEDVWAQALQADAGMGGSLDLGNADVITLNSKSGMSSTVKIRQGSAESGRAQADMSARISLSGDFGAIQRKESMSGRVSIDVNRGDGSDRFLRASKRGFNRDVWDEPYTGILALAMGASMGPALQQGMAEALGDEAFVSAVCKAIAATYRESSVLEALRKVATALEGVLGPVENLGDDPQVVAQAIGSPSVAEPYGAAFQLFLTTAFKKAESFVS